MFPIGADLYDATPQDGWASRELRRKLSYSEFCGSPEIGTIVQSSE